MALLLTAIWFGQRQWCPLRSWALWKKCFKHVPMSTRLSYEGQEFMADALLKYQPVPKDITQVMKRLTMVSTYMSCPPETCH